MVRVLGRELFVGYLRLRALPSLRFQVSNQNGFRPFCLPTAKGSTNGKRNARRTAHRQPHQGRTRPPRAQHHLARQATRLFAAKRLQDLQPPLDLYGLVAQNLRFAGLRFLPMLYGLEKRKEKGLKYNHISQIFRTFAAPFRERNGIFNLIHYNK